MAATHTIQVNGSPMRIYVDAPDDAMQRRCAAVLVMIHGPGLDRFIEAQVEALATHGFIAASCDLFHRQPSSGAPPTDTTAIMARVGKLRDDEIITDAVATVAYLKARGDLELGPLAVIGFCMGGRNAYLLAGARPELWSAAGIFYGGNMMKPWSSDASPLDRSGQITCPLIGFFGADDTNPSPDDVAQIDAELTRLDKPHTFHSYPGAGHAFLNFTNPDRHRPTQAADAWAKLIAFLDERLRLGIVTPRP